MLFDFSLEILKKAKENGLRFLCDDIDSRNPAIDLFKKSIECNPNYALAHFNLARAITVVGDKIEAAKLYQIAQDINKVTNEIDPQDITNKINNLFES